jgi:origin recognition complex subunit 2
MSSPESSSGSDSEVDAIVQHSQRHENGPGFIHQTSFDAYFLQASRASKTSANVFSDIVPPLSREEYLGAITPVRERHVPLIPLDALRPWFAQYRRELAAGFNLLFYGFGSKQQVLNAFAREVCAKRGHVIVASAHRPDFSLRDLFASAERISELADEPLPSSGIEGQTQRLQAFFSSEHKARAPLFLVIHNIDAPSLRSHKTAACIAALASTPRIHVVASIDHINAPLLFPLSDSMARKASGADGTAGGHGYAWLWHDLTTLAPYDAELAYADPGSISSVSGASGRAAQAALADPAVAMTETAAQHILASVTQRAKKLFALVGARQLAVMEEAGDAAAREPRRSGIAYDGLFVLARDQFVATSDGALRALLGEFKDHGLIVSTSSEESGGKEMLHIPLRKERLAKVLQACE